MIKITDIQKQVIEGKLQHLKPIFKKTHEEIFNWKLERNMMITDSDFEEFKYILQDKGIYLTWKAIEKFYGVKF